MRQPDETMTPQTSRVEVGTRQARGEKWKVEDGAQQQSHKRLGRAHSNQSRQASGGWKTSERKEVEAEGKDLCSAVVG